jgi:hypothetical protein
VTLEREGDLVVPTDIRFARPMSFGGLGGLYGGKGIARRVADVATRRRTK